MAIALQQAEGKVTIRLAGSLGIEASEELKKGLLDAFDSSREVHMDLSEVTYLDGTALQLLWAGRQQAAATAATWTFDAVPDAVRTAAEEAGFPQALLAGSASEERQ